jgi:hypothetical protein
MYVTCAEIQSKTFRALDTLTGTTLIPLHNHVLQIAKKRKEYLRLEAFLTNIIDCDSREC